VERNSVSLTREELYEKVWTTPSTKLAEEFGFSDVALAKLCKKHGIPKPPLGYWARVQHGQKPKRASLLPLQSGKAEKIVIQRSAPTSAKPKKIVDEIELRPEGESFHALAQLTLTELNSNRVDKNGIWWRKPNSGLDVAVSQKNVGRAIRIIDTLIKHLEKLGHKILVLPDEKGGKSIANIDGEAVSFQLREKLTRVAETTDDNEVRSPFAWYRPRPRYNEVPSGSLSLLLDAMGSYGMKKKTWTEQPRWSLENQLGAFVQGMLEAAVYSKKANEENRRWRREQEAREREEQETRRKKREEHERIERLELEFKNWEKEVGLKLFAAQIEELAKAEDPNSERGKWLNWAKEHFEKNPDWAPEEKVQRVPSYEPSRPAYVPWWYVLHNRKHY